MKTLMKASLTVLSILVLASTAAAADGIKVVEQPDQLPSFLGYVPDRFVVVMKPNVGKLSIRGATVAGAVSIGDPSFDAISQQFAVSGIRKQFAGSRLGADSKTAELAQYHKITIGTGTLEDAMDAYRNHPKVERVEPIGIHAMYATPNDGFYDPYQWYHNATGDHDIDSPEAWDIQTGADATVVAILDSGTRYYHPDLGGANASPGNPGASRGNMWINNTELNGSAGVDDDGNGYTDDWIGYDFIQTTSSCWSGEDCSGQDNDPRDFNGHGTHTAGIFGMITNDGYGMAGVAGGWGNGTQQVTANGVRVMPLRMGYSYNWFGQEYGVVLMDAAAEAFYYAADNGADIASCSWGSSNSGGIGAAATYFLNAGGIIFVAAGNDGSQTADYLNGRGDCISVSATNENDNGASFTTYGTWVDICAPGNNIYSTYHDHYDPNTNYWASLSGTSMATPMAAGVAALIWSQNPGWNASQVTSQLYSSADNIDAFLSGQYIGKMGAGRINAFNAVNTGTPAPVAAFTGSPTSGCASLNVNFTDQSTGSITSWSWDFGDAGTSTAQNPSHSYASPGTYTVSLTVAGPGGSDNNTKTNYITVDGAPTADFSGTPTTGTEPLTVSFTDLSTGGATSWSWDFGDAGTSTQQNPSHEYATAGTYTVTLTATNACGSDQNVKTNYITVDPCITPTAGFVGAPTSGDFPLLVNFTDQSTDATSWSWDFGDAGTSTQQNPSHTYTAAGTYTVTQTVTNSCGSDQLVRTNYITVTTPPVPPTADFSGTPTSGCAPLAVNFTDLSTGDVTSWSWDFGDAGTSTAQNPSHSYAAAGTYTVSLTASGPGGSDINTKVGYITVSDAPTADFSGTPTSGVEPLTVNFTDLSTGGATSWSWNFGDAGTSTQQNPSHEYASAGTYTVTLTATNACGSDQNGKTNYITVNPCVTPTAGFVGAPTSGDYPLVVNFTDQSSNASSWSWDFGDAGTSTAQNPSHTYTAAGTYTVTQTVTNACGSDQLVRTNYITVTTPPVPPTADFSGTPTSGCAPLLVSFTDLSTGDVTSWSWDFGDGGTSTAQNPSHTYASGGSYTVSLTATGPGGSDNNTKANYITVDVAPVADFSGSPTNGNVPLTVNFSDLSTNGPTSWSWDFGDGGTSTAQNPSYVYNAAGTYTVALTASNACGSDVNTKVGYITVNDGPITGEGFILSRNADFSTDDRVFNRGETLYMKVWTDQVDFNDLSRQRWELKDSPGNRVRQDFTNHFDNTYTASFALANLPSSEIDWTWKGEVKDNQGNRYKPSTTITVNSGPTPPVADFSGTPTSGCAPLAVNFTDLSTGGVDTWSWDFGDGGTSTLQNPSHSYAAAGSYTVSLTATGPGGSDVNAKAGYITVSAGAPTADFSGTPTTGDRPLLVNFSDLSTNGPTSWSWDFGDGGTSTAQNPSHTYNTAGTYSVALTASNVCGSDINTKVGYVTVTEPPCNPPVAGFTGAPTTGNAPLTVSFTDQTTNLPSSWSWDFGDGGTSTAQNPNYTYNAVGTYTVTLTASNACGSDQSVQTDYITVNDGGPVTGEGFILSRNSDFSTDDRAFDINETIYMKVWTDQVDFNDLKKSEWELRDANKNKIKQSLTNNFDNTYTASFVLASLPSSATDWEWRGKVEDKAGTRYRPSTFITVTGGLNGLSGLSASTAGTRFGNAPNPFNAGTNINFRLDEGSQVQLVVYDVLGRAVRELANGYYPPGSHTLRFDGTDRSGSDLASGLYFYRLVTSDLVVSRKMVLMK